MGFGPCITQWTQSAQTGLPSTPKGSWPSKDTSLLHKAADTPKPRARQFNGQHAAPKLGHPSQREGAFQKRHSPFQEQYQKIPQNPSDRSSKTGQPATKEPTT